MGRLGFYISDDPSDAACRLVFCTGSCEEWSLVMGEVKEFSYETRLSVLCQPLEVIDEKALADACTHKWYNQTLCAVNESVVRLGVVEGEYHWHKHDTDDEFFYVVEGQLLIDLEDRTVELSHRFHKYAHVL